MILRSNTYKSRTNTLISRLIPITTSLKTAYTISSTELLLAVFIVITVRLSARRRYKGIVNFLIILVVIR